MGQITDFAINTDTQAMAKDKARDLCQLLVVLKHENPNLADIYDIFEFLLRMMPMIAPELNPNNIRNKPWEDTFLAIVVRSVMKKLEFTVVKDIDYSLIENTAKTELSSWLR